MISILVVSSLLISFRLLCGQRSLSLGPSLPVRRILQVRRGAMDMFNSFSNLAGFLKPSFTVKLNLAILAYIYK